MRQKYDPTKFLVERFPDPQIGRVLSTLRVMVKGLMNEYLNDPDGFVKSEAEMEIRDQMRRHTSELSDYHHHVERAYSKGDRKLEMAVTQLIPGLVGKNTRREYLIRAGCKDCGIRFDPITMGVSDYVFNNLIKH